MTLFQKSRVCTKICLSESQWFQIASLIAIDTLNTIRSTGSPSPSGRAAYMAALASRTCYRILFCRCSAAQSCLTLQPTDCRTPGPSVPHHLQKFAQVYVPCLGDAIQPSHPLTPSSTIDLSQHQGLFQ